MNNPNSQSPSRRRKQGAASIGLGIALGIALGAALGNIALGLAIGILIGGLGAIWRTKKTG